jgi:serine/threonine-protein kinase
MMFWRKKEDLTGKNLGAFGIIEMIGAGDYAAVYRARRLNGPGDVAVKVLTIAETKHKDLLSHFRRQARILRHLDHPQVVQVIDYGVTDKYLYIVMDIATETLAEKLAGGSDRGDPAGDGSALPFDEAVEIAREMCMALSYIHSRGIIHRDVKPTNILRGMRHYVLSDFGFAKLIAVEMADSIVTREQNLVLNAYYVSPEVAVGREVGPASDIYSLGAVLYHMLTGKPPFSEEKNRFKVIGRHLSEPFPRVADLRPDLPHLGEIDELLQDCTRKNQSERVAAADDLLSRLNALGPSPFRDAAVVCPGCHTQLGRDALFCPRCGRRTF